MKTDADLLRAYREGRSQDAFEDLVQRYANLVYGTALRHLRGDVQRAEDVTQAVFTILARRAGSLVEHPVLAGWLHTTARFIASQTGRAERRRKRRELEAHAMNELCSPETTATDWDRLRPVIDEVVAELNPADRDAVLLRFFSGQRFGEIGAALNASEDAVRMRVDRALDRLRVRLNQRGITSTGAALSMVLSSHAAMTAPVGFAVKVAGIALGSGSAGAFMVTGLWQALGTTKGVLLAGTAAAVAVGFGLVQTNDLRAREAALADEMATLETQLQQAEQRVAALERGVDRGSEPVRTEASSRELGDRGSRQSDLTGQSVRSAEDERSFTPAPLSLRGATHVAFIIDTSGSMRDPRGGALKVQVVIQIEAILSTNPNVEYVQFFDADGRFMLGRKGQWLPNRPATRAAITDIFPRYNIHSNSNPVPAVFRVIQMPWDTSHGDVKTSVVILGDELAGDKAAVLARLDEVNPPDAEGRRRVSINAVAFPVRLDTPTVGSFSTLMEQIAAEHGGSFVRAE